MANHYARPKRIVRAVRRGTTARHAAAEAKVVLASISRDVLTDKCQVGVQEDVAALQQIIEGGPKARNASSRVRAIQLKWGYGYGYPKQQIEASMNVSLAALLIESMPGGGKGREIESGNGNRKNHKSIPKR